MVVDTVQIAIEVIMALFCLVLSKYRYEKNKEYAEKYFDDPTVLIVRLIITSVLKWGSVGVLLLTFLNKIPLFFAFYIVPPIILSLNLILFDYSEWMWGLFTAIKGAYYAGIAIISFCQYYLTSDADIIKSALGFTLSLGIFESITAISNGFTGMREARRKTANK